MTAATACHFHEINRKWETSKLVGSLSDIVKYVATYDIFHFIIGGQDAYLDPCCGGKLF